MKPEIWGSHMWKSIHYIALDYSNTPTDEEKTDYKLFFMNLYKVLPCYECSKHLKEIVSKHPITDNILENSNTLFNWTVDIHNIVNEKLNKKQISYAQAVALLHTNEVSPTLQVPQERTNPKNMISLFYYIIFIVMIIMTYANFMK